MEFRFTGQQEAFRREIRAFLFEGAAGVSTAMDLGGTSPDRFDRYRAFQKRMAERGWLTLAWPKEWGGQAADYMTQLVFNEEMAYWGAPNPGIGVDRVGPTLILHGTGEQKARYLPGIASAGAMWCQGFTEPGSGSDLASLQTKATLDGDSWLINGQKMFTSLAHVADYCVLLARTDPDAPKHRGIGYFLLDMKSPGITVRPLHDVLGNHTFNEVFLEDVRIPRECLVGEPNRGWYLAATTLDFERSGIHRMIGGQRPFEELVRFVSESPQMPARTSVRHQLAEVAIGFQVGRMLAYRVAAIQQAGGIPNVEASVSKLFGSELTQRVANMGIGVLGLAGQLRPGSPYAPLAGRFERMYLNGIQATVGAGTSEVQRNIVATRGLGMPRG